MAGSANDIALVPMDPSGYDSSEPTAMDLVHARRQTGPGLPRVGVARHHLSHALAAPNRAGRGPGCATRGGGIGSAGSHLDCLGRGGFGAASGPVVLLAYINSTAERRLVKHGYEPGTLMRALRERDHREHADQIVRYMQTYRKAGG